LWALPALVQKAGGPAGSMMSFLELQRALSNLGAWGNAPNHGRGLAGRELSAERTDHRGMEADNLPILYIKTGCPWCTEVVEFMDSHGVSYREMNVSDDASAMTEMQRKSGQTRAPTLDWNGRILADFGVDELVPFLRKQNVKLEDS
jgi:glutaredoxin